MRPSLYLTCFGLAACIGQRAEAPPRIGPASALPPDADPPAEWVDAKGRRYELVGRAKTITVEPGHFLQGPQAGLDSLARTPEESLRERAAAVSLDTLAESIRPMTVRGDWEYRLATPDYETAQKILDAMAKGPSDKPDTMPGPGEDREGRNCCGTDNRTRSRDNTVFPQAPTVFSETGCSGVMISPTTMVTAAHCVYDTVANAWLQVTAEPSWGGSRWPRYAHGVDGVDADATPFTHNGAESYDVTVSGGNFSTTSPGAYIQCYDVYVPGPYGSAGGCCGDSDYAVIDFQTRCGYSPGNLVSWWGTWVRDETPTETNTAWMIGYPQTAQNGANINSATLTFRHESLWGGAWFEAQLWLDNGTPTIGSDKWKLRYTAIDTTAGNSGSGIYQQDNGSGTFLIGTHIGVAAQDAYNFGRRWDWTYRGFAEANTPFPN